MDGYTRTINPCLDCDIRADDCHEDGKCRRGDNGYVKWKAAVELQKEKTAAESFGDQAMIEYEITRAKKARDGRLKRRRR